MTKIELSIDTLDNVVENFSTKEHLEYKLAVSYVLPLFYFSKLNQKKDELLQKIDLYITKDSYIKLDDKVYKVDSNVNKGSILSVKLNDLYIEGSKELTEIANETKKWFSENSYLGETIATKSLYDYLSDMENMLPKETICELFKVLTIQKQGEN